MRIHPIIAVVFLQISCTAEAYADSTAHDVNELIRISEEDDRFKGLLTGAGRAFDGLRAYNIINKKQPLYCQPQNLVITGDQYIRITSSFIEKYPNYGKLDLNAFGYVMLEALIDTFPCN
jgi:hypothetical protein